MTLFWFLAAVLVALALVLVLPALLNPQVPVAATPGSGNRSILREQLAQLDAERAAGDLTAEQHALAHAELQRRALEEDDKADGAQAGRTSAIGAVLLALAIPAMAFSIYGVLGNPQGLQPQVASARVGEEVTAADVEAMVARLSQRLEDTPPGQPADPQAWEMLARSYAALRRFPEASRSYARAVQLAPDNAQLLADHADMLAMLQGQVVEGEPLKLVERALALDPSNIKALALAGAAASDRKDFAAAVGYWSKAEALAPTGSDVTAYLTRSLAEARQALGRGSQPPASAAAPVAPSTVSSRPPVAPQVAGAASAVQGVVQLAPSLAARVEPGDTVFIFARAAQGPRMPLAILRHKASELPIRFRLDDGTAMAAGAGLSGTEQVVVGARITRSGNAMPQSGDLVGWAGPLPTSAGASVTLTIDSVQP